MLADYQEQTGTINVGATTTTLTATMPYSTASGVYTPLWAFDNAQFTGISQSGAGTISNQYVLFNNPTTATCTFCGGVTAANNLSANFYSSNDYTFESFSGVFLNDTSAYVNVYAPPSFCVHSATSRGVTTYYYLNIQFFETSNVTLSHASCDPRMAGVDRDLVLHHGPGISEPGAAGRGVRLELHARPHHVEHVRRHGTH